MPGIIQSPVDTPPMPTQDLSPPIIPNLTQMSPGHMRAVMREMTGMGMEEDMAPSGDAMMDDEEMTPPQIVAMIGKLFYQAGEYPGLQEAIHNMMKALMKAGQGSNVSSMTLLRMPRPLSLPPFPEESGVMDLAPPMPMVR